MGIRIFWLVWSATKSVPTPATRTPLFLPGIFLIAEGSVKIFKMAPSGREMMLALERAPSTVAELPLFDGGAYPASVRAAEPVVAYFINKADFQSVCREFP